MRRRILTRNEVRKASFFKLTRTYSAKSIAQIPVPVPTSSTRWGFSIGAKYSFPSRTRLKTWWSFGYPSDQSHQNWNVHIHTRSIRSCSSSSLGLDFQYFCVDGTSNKSYHQIFAISISMVSPTILKGISIFNRFKYTKPYLFSIMLDQRIYFRQKLWEYSPISSDSRR